MTGVKYQQSTLDICQRMGRRGTCGRYKIVYPRECRRRRRKWDEEDKQKQKKRQ